MIKTAVIGAGYIGNVHIEALNRIPGVTVNSVYDLNEELARKTAVSNSISHVADSLEEVLSDKEIDVVHICTPNHLHLDQVKQVIKAGKHVFCEKPLALTCDEAALITDLAERNQRITGIGFCYRYYPVVQEMAKRVKSGEYGQVRMVSGSWFQDWLSNIDDYSWRLDKHMSGPSNVAADLGSHWFDLIQFVTGLEVSDVLADFFTIIPVRKKPLKQVLAFQKAQSDTYEEMQIEVEDYASILFRLDEGKVPGSFTTSQVCCGRKSDTEFQIYCSEGSVAWNHKRSNELWIGRRSGPNGLLIENPLEMSAGLAKYSPLPAGHPLGYLDAVKNMLSDYYDAVSQNEEGNGLDRPNFSTGYREMLLLEKVLESTKNTKWVKIH